MTLMSRETGHDVDDQEHLKQSIRDILTTPRGSRVWNREYGCDLFYLIDRSITPLLVSQMYGAITEALDRWEPRLSVTQVKLDVTQSPQGILLCDLEGLYIPQGKPIRLQHVELVFSSDRNIR